MEVIKLYVEVNVMGHINLKTKKFIPSHINKGGYIRVKHKTSILIKLAKKCYMEQFLAKLLDLSCV
jgi:hypothetical protein